MRYGRTNEYSARGNEYNARRYNDYGRQNYGGNYNNYSNYGAEKDPLRALEHMLNCTCEFVKMLKDGATSQQEADLIQEYLQKMGDM